MRMHDHEAPARLTAAQAAKEAGLSKRTILYAIERGELKADNPAGLGYVITRAAFERYMSKRAA